MAGYEIENYYTLLFCNVITHHNLLLYLIGKVSCEIRKVHCQPKKYHSFPRISTRDEDDCKLSFDGKTASSGNLSRGQCRTLKDALCTRTEES